MAKTIVSFIGGLLCIICGVCIGLVLAGSEIPYLKEAGYVSAVLVGAVYVFIKPMLNQPNS